MPTLTPTTLKPRQICFQCTYIACDAKDRAKTTSLGSQATYSTKAWKREQLQRQATYYSIIVDKKGPS